MAKETAQTYIEAVGRRKTAIARVRITPAAKRSVTINDTDVEGYFPTAVLRARSVSPFAVEEMPQGFSVSVKVLGGGISSQAEAIRHGIARALVKSDAQLRKALKQAGYLKRDPREKERRKFGLKKARKAKQWSKR